MISTKISATEAARSFSDVLNRVKYRAEEFLVERAGEAVARISPAGSSRSTLLDLVELFKVITPADKDFAPAVEEAIQWGAGGPYEDDELQAPAAAAGGK